MINLKYFNVKNERCTLSQIFGLDDGDFICVINSKVNIVAKCHYNIVKKFLRDFTEKELLLISQHDFKKTVLEHIRELKLTSQNMHLYQNKIKDDKLIVSGLTYRLVDSYCQLDNIEITNENYYKVGVGSFIIKSLENYALSQDCKRIEGWYYPNGPFADGSRDFYIRNGFEFVQDEYKNKTYVIKNLEN